VRLPDAALSGRARIANRRAVRARRTGSSSRHHDRVKIAPTQPPRDITPPTPATSAYFQDYNDCIMRYTMAPPESQSCRAGQLCGTNYMQKPIGQGCTHATGHFDGPCYAK